MRLAPPVPLAPPTKPPQARDQRDEVAELERMAAVLIASGEHLGPSEDLIKRLGQPQSIHRQGRQELWRYGRYAFVVEDGLVLNVRTR